MSLPALKIYHKEPYPAISPKRAELSQAGKTVLVAGVGASYGIGFAIARSFINAGSKRVIIVGRRPDAVAAAAAKLNEETESNAAEGRTGDLSNIDSMQRLWSALETENIYVDVLVLNGAAFGKSMPILEAGVQTSWSDFETNVRGPLFMTDAFYKQTTGKGKKYLANVSTIAAYMWTTMGPERPTYGLTKNAGTALLQQIAKDTSVDDMQIVSFHPGGVWTVSGESVGIDKNSGIRWDHEDLPGNFAVWATSPEAAFLHGRFVWANWDVEELKNGVVAKQIQEDEHFLKVGIEGLTEKTGGAIF